MHKNFLKIGFILTLFVGMFFVAGNVKAVDCCVIKERPPLSYGPQYDYVEMGCRLKGAGVCTSVPMPSRWGCVKSSGCATQEQFIKIETQINCAAKPACMAALTKELTDCGSLKSPDDCGIPAALCFWSTSRMCYSRSDATLCPGMGQADCNEMAKAGCKWEGDRCLNPLLQAVSDQYTGGMSATQIESKYTLFKSCFLDGSCRKLSDILYTVFQMVNMVFKYIGAIAFIFFIFGGFTMILSFGNSEKFKKGQQILVAAVIGLVIVFSAYLMVTFLLEALGVSAEFKAIK